ncbi:MAG TPA: pyridoxal phosphate-dependent aminotransferase, partial [Calditrichaeota bacterium]|nr:pyridoxal phosphate-dependent aminotransferase [Calditrichota bacterium]
MKILSRRGMEMPSSPIRRLTVYAERATSAGKHVFHLNIGQPDIKTPDTFMHPIKNLNMPVLAYGPSGGLMSLREKLSIYYKRFNIDVEAEDILITTGGSEAILYTLMAIT